MLAALTEKDMRQGAMVSVLMTTHTAPSLKNGIAGNVGGSNPA